MVRVRVSPLPVRLLWGSVAALSLGSVCLVSISGAEPAVQFNLPTIASPRTVAQATKAPMQAETVPASPERRSLHIPKELPGADAPRLQVPPFDAQNPQARKEAIDKLFPPLPPLPASITVSGGPLDQPLSPDEAVSIGLMSSPNVQQATALIRSAYGEAIQAGMLPNPTLGYEGDTIGTLDTAGYHGPFVTQTIKRGGKLTLARESLMVNVRNAELTLQRTRVEVSTVVLARYFDVLVAMESMRATEALARFTDEAYRLQLELLRGGEAAAYEPMQLRVLAMQARATLLQSRNRYIAALKQLAAAMSVGDMPPTHLSGDLHLQLPDIDFPRLEHEMLMRHPDILAARNSVQQARIDVRRAEVVPIPDLLLYSTVQKDYTGPPFGTTVNVQASMAIPVFDRNIGGITQAQGLLAKAANEELRVRNTLLTQFAAAFERYENSRLLVAIYRRQILPDQARSYRGVYERYQQQPEHVGFGDVVLAQQTLAQATSAYLNALAEQWRAVADLLTQSQLMSIEELQTFGLVSEPPDPSQMQPPQGIPAPPVPLPAR